MLLPPCKEKRCDEQVFDPDKLLFSTGVHMPLLIFMGDKSRRTDEALVNREAKAKQRKGKGISKGEGKGKPPGKAVPPAAVAATGVATGEAPPPAMVMAIGTSSSSSNDRQQ